MDLCFSKCTCFFLPLISFFSIRMVVKLGSRAQQKKPILSSVAATIAFIKLRRLETREKSTEFEKGETEGFNLAQKFTEMFLTEDDA